MAQALLPLVVVQILGKNMCGKGARMGAQATSCMTTCEAAQRFDLGELKQQTDPPPPFVHYSSLFVSLSPLLRQFLPQNPLLLGPQNYSFWSRKGDLEGLGVGEGLEGVTPQNKKQL